MTTLNMTYSVTVNANDDLPMGIIDNGKQGLLTFVWYVTNEKEGKTIFEEYDYYICNDNDAQLFIDTIWDGNIDDFGGNLRRYLEAYVYTVEV